MYQYHLLLVPIGIFSECGKYFDFNNLEYAISKCNAGSKVIRNGKIIKTDVKTIRSLFLTRKYGLLHDLACPEDKKPKNDTDIQKYDHCRQIIDIIGNLICILYSPIEARYILSGKTR